jgi:asparagine synthase (glutamine-hydrolysing)
MTMQAVQGARMTGVFGWAGHPEGKPSELIDAMAAAYTRFDGSQVRAASSSAGAMAVAGRRPGHLYVEGEKLVAVSGRPRLTDSNLGSCAERHGVAQAIAEGYARDGARVLAGISGSFTLGILDGRRGEALLAMDRMGTGSLFYECVAGKLAFASTLDALRAFPGTDGEVSHQGIYDYVYFHMVPGPSTVYTRRRRLLPGTYLLWSNGSVRTASYWQMQFQEGESRPFEELQQDFLALVRKSVSDAAQDGATGCFLSGGTDSSTIAGMFGEATGRPARTYSIGFAAPGYDEMHFARVAARHFGTVQREYYVEPEDVVSAIPRIAAVHDQPFGNSSAVPAYYCAKLARDDGIDTLLAGDGGDELFGGNERYATQYLYSLYSDLPPAVRRLALDPVISVLPKSGITAKVHRYVATASMPMPARYDHYNLVERLGPSDIFTPSFMSGVRQDLPALQAADAYGASAAQSLINRMLAFDLKYTLADNDLPKVTRSCELAGIDARFPLLSDEVVAFSARLPPDLKLRGTRLRYFFKQALRDFLPAEIINKTKHGFGLPFGTWFESHQPLREIALDSLADLKKRDIVRPGFIDELTGLHVRRHASYYGTMVWVLMMLEQWLKQHRVSI